jgi:hypothetical protein
MMMKKMKIEMWMTWPRGLERNAVPAVYQMKNP